jgi:hypothetical protein
VPMAMKTRSINFSEPASEFLKAEADKLGISVSELIRRIIDAYRESRNVEKSIATKIGD